MTTVVGDRQAVEATKNDSFENSSTNEDDDLFREIWERECQPELSFEVAGMGKVLHHFTSCIILPNTVLFWGRGLWGVRGIAL